MGGQEAACWGFRVCRADVGGALFPVGTGTCCRLWRGGGGRVVGEGEMRFPRAERFGHNSEGGAMW